MTRKKIRGAFLSGWKHKKRYIYNAPAGISPTSCILLFCLHTHAVNPGPTLNGYLSCIIIKIVPFELSILSA